MLLEWEFFKLDAPSDAYIKHITEKKQTCKLHHSSSLINTADISVKQKQEQKCKEITA